MGLLLAAVVSTLERFPLPWSLKTRGDGLVNPYSGGTAIALCVRPDVAALIVESVQAAADTGKVLDIAYDAERYRK